MDETFLTQMERLAVSVATVGTSIIRMEHQVASVPMGETFLTQMEHKVASVPMVGTSTILMGHLAVYRHQEETCFVINGRVY